MKASNDDVDAEDPPNQGSDPPRVVPGGVVPGVVTRAAAKKRAAIATPTTSVSPPENRSKVPRLLQALPQLRKVKPVTAVNEKDAKMEDVVLDDDTKEPAKM